MAPPFTIRTDDLTSPAVLALLREHLAAAAAHSPPGCVHALDVGALRGGDVTFWSVWREGDLAGIGALKELDPIHGELKSMRTAREHLRQGVAATLVTHMLEVAKARGYRRVSLETGAMDEFAPAHAFYASVGFTPCEPFGEYIETRTAFS